MARSAHVEPGGALGIFQMRAIYSLLVLASLLRYHSAEENEGGGKAWCRRPPFERVYGLNNFLGYDEGAFFLRPGPLMVSGRARPVASRPIAPPQTPTRAERHSST